MHEIKMATYHNPTGEAVELKIGNGPGDPPSVFKCQAGGTVEGPANYVEAFKRAGLQPVAEGFKPPAAARAERGPTEDDPSKGVTIGSGTTDEGKGKRK